MSQVNDFIQRLDACPMGTAGWSRFENLCTEILAFLFVPPLNQPTRQGRTYSGVNRRDAIIPNRNITANATENSKNWHHLYLELEARMILFEFKNYDATEIGHEEVNQTRNYMTAAMGRLSIMICSKIPNDSAHRQRNTVYNQDNKVIIFITKEQLKEMLLIKDRNEDPSDLIMDLIERFYIQHE
ncbi:hypothetical protein [Winogradskyella schleiferi]|jgi:hypothetical protein|uniref:hypothetical protein n=1 Tax=Winogradskyella schleiferi TaxID=2686078 RepID=UPI0015C0CE2F|nr:hypothetical protein [Winogradskyella schleiferi]